jgi:hypothetical protein
LEYFFQDGKAPLNERGSKGGGLSAEKQEAIVSNIAFVAEFIPGIGTAVSKGLAVVNFFVKPAEDDSTQSKDVKAMTRAVQQLETNLKQYLNDEAFTKENSFLLNLSETIKN